MAEHDKRFGLVLTEEETVLLDRLHLLMRCTRAQVLRQLLWRAAEKEGIVEVFDLKAVARYMNSNH